MNQRLNFYHQAFLSLLIVFTLSLYGCSSNSCIPGPGPDPDPSSDSESDSGSSSDSDSSSGSANNGGCADIILGIVDVPTNKLNFTWGDPQSPHGEHEVWYHYAPGGHGTGIAFNAKVTSDQGFNIGLNSHMYSVIFLLEYTIPAQNCDATISYIATPRLTLPGGVCLSPDYTNNCSDQEGFGSADFQFISFENAIGGLPQPTIQAKAVECLSSRPEGNYIHFTKSREENIRKIGHITGEFNVAKGIESRVYIGLAVQLHATGGAVFLNGYPNAYSLNNGGLFEVWPMSGEGIEWSAKEID